SSPWMKVTWVNKTEALVTLDVSSLRNRLSFAADMARKSSLPWWKRPAVFVVVFFFARSSERST
ncbi:MAG TPA: hypothetical protein VGE37_04620, partial [Archangium sp.]